MAVSFVFGLVVGSFLNVTIYRLPRGESLRAPGSHCPSCGAPIRWYDNIPVVSFLLLRGRCRACKGKISIRYPVVEILTGAIYAFLFYRMLVAPGEGHIGVFLVYAVLASMLISASFIDMAHQIIPDEITIPGMMVAPLVSLLYPALHESLFFAEPHLGALANSVAGMAIGAASIYLTGVLGKWAFKREAMGFGDVKLLGMIGGFLGWKAVSLTFILAPILGSIIGAIVALRTRNRVIPYGPFLSLAALVSMTYGNEVIVWYVSLFTS